MNDIFENYKSPITIYSDFENQILQEQENQIMCKIRTVVDVDKDELIKALNYDRKQYEAGYKAGVQQMRQHGHWEKLCGNKFSYLYKCSNCGEDVLTSDIDCYRYCHHCGAEMNEGSKDENI